MKLPQNLSGIPEWWFGVKSRFSVLPRTKSSQGLSTLLAPLLSLTGLLVIWQLTVDLAHIPELLLPGPLAVVRAAIRILPELLAATLRTTTAAMTGLLASCVLGILTAFLFSVSPLMRRALYPYAVLLQTVPIIAIAPIVIVSFGRGFVSIALISCVISLFPIITNATTGLLQTDRDLTALFRLHHATWLQTLLKLRLPASLPYLLTGIRIAGGAAIVGAIVGEFFVGSGQPGLGALIQRKTASLALPELYAAVAASTLLGTAVFSSISATGDWILRRWFGMSLDGVQSSH